MYKWMRLRGVFSCQTFLNPAHKGVQNTRLTPDALIPLQKSHLKRFSPCRRFSDHDSSDLLQHEAVQKYLQGLVLEYRDISQRLQNESASESERKALSKRHIELIPLATAFQNIENTMNDLKDLEALSESNSVVEDPRMVELLKEEHAEISKQLQALREVLLQTLTPCDRHDTNDVILEVVSGRTTGGDICQQFTKEVFDMYENYANYKKWNFDIYNYTPSDYGGLHHAAVRVSGENVYKFLKHEGGTHRVQRIPLVGLSSRMQRIHTGTMTVIVLPQPNNIDLDIDPKELQVDTFRSRGAGGQSVNTTDSAVRIVHIPTGITAECQESRSQLKNRETAMRVLRARIYQQIIDKENEEILATRKRQVGTRAQSERIRTYNFTQDRVTDHRMGHVTRNIKELLQGGELLDELITELVKHAEKEALLELVTQSTEHQNRH
ncbi:peptide chain release factor 1, mitochondrial [Arapaima gigas]